MGNFAKSCKEVGLGQLYIVSSLSLLSLYWEISRKEQKEKKTLASACGLLVFLCTALLQTKSY